MEDSPIRPSGDPDALLNVADTETVHHDVPSAKAKKPGGVAALQLTSMMDVCFQLLIFFVVTASFAINEGILAADLPAGMGKKVNDAKPPDQPIRIILRSLGGDDIAIQIEGNTGQPPASFSDLFEWLRAQQHTQANPTGVYNPEDPVIIQPDGTVAWGHVVNTFNAAIRAKYTNVNFAPPGKK